MITIRFVEVVGADGEPRLVEWVDVLRAEPGAWPHLRPYPLWRDQVWGWVGLRPPQVEVPS